MKHIENYFSHQYMLTGLFKIGYLTIPCITVTGSHNQELKALFKFKFPLDSRSIRIL